MDVPMVLVISPDPDSRRLIGLNLSKRGFHTLRVSRQDELALPSAHPQLIIWDVETLDKSGWAATETLRRKPWAQGVPLILIVSAAPTASQLASCQPVRWVEKPLAMDALLALVREILAQEEARREM